MSVVQARVYRSGELIASDCPLAEVSEHLDHDETNVWIDLVDPSPAELQQIAEELGLHELAVEDALGPHQRPKLDHYTTHAFFACHAVRVAPERGELAGTEIDAFIGDRWLVSVRKDDQFSMEPVVQRLERSPALASFGVSYLVYGLLDVVVDGYFDAVQAFDDYYDSVSEGLFADRPLALERQRHWFQMRRSLVRLHRLIVPMREVVSALMRADVPEVPAPLYPYYQDVYDHLLRVTEATDALRELVGSIVETDLSLRDYRQNLIVKKVTSWAAIIAVPTLITGFYGMNVPYPGSGQVSGVLSAVAAIVALSGGLYMLFRSKDWL
jgi:magnesium transporter